MLLVVRGRSKVISTKETRYITNYMSSLIMSKQLCKNLRVIVKYVKDIDGDGDGRMIWLDDNHNPREYMIEINNTLKRDRQLEAIAHEITHVKQYAKGELKDMVRGANRVKWHSRPVSNDTDYWFEPWEIEARGFEAALTWYYKAHVKDTKKKF